MTKVRLTTLGAACMLMEMAALWFLWQYWPILSRAIYLALDRHLGGCQLTGC